MAVLSLVLCDDPHISHLNSLHRGKEGPTDVLSFELGDELDYKVGRVWVNTHSVRACVQQRAQ